MKEITIEELKAMRGCEGLILQGCGGDLAEWEDGITDELTERGILPEGERFKDVRFFNHEGLTCILFPLEGAKLDVGKLALWRIETRSLFGGTWQSDYLMNRFSIDINQSQPAGEKKKPDCPLIGADGNIFNLVGIAAGALKGNGMQAESKEMQERVFSGKSYEEALAVIGEYVNITSAEEMEAGGDEDEQIGMGMD